METAIARHLVQLKVEGYSVATVDTRAWTLGLFRRWASERGILLLAEVTPEVIARYQRQLSQHRKEDGQPLTSRTQRTRLASLRMFGRWILREKLLAENPVAALVMPRIGQSLPKAWLTAAQAETVLALPKLDERPSARAGIEGPGDFGNSIFNGPAPDGGRKARRRQTWTLPAVWSWCGRAREKRIASCPSVTVRWLGCPST